MGEIEKSLTVTTVPAANSTKGWERSRRKSSDETPEIIKTLLKYHFYKK